MASTNIERQLQPLEALANLRRLVEPQHAVVDEDARQLIADRAVNEQRGDRRIDAAAQRRRRRVPSPTCARIRAVASSTNDAIVQSPVQPQTPKAKLRRISSAALGVHDFGMEQQRVERRARRLPSRRPARWRWSRRPRSPAARRRRSRRGSPRRAARTRHRREEPARVVPAIVDRARGRTRAAAPARPARRACRPSAACRSRCRAPACPASNTAGSHRRRAALRTRSSARPTG